MQEQLMAAQQEMAAKEFEGTAGGGVVKAIVGGGGELRSVTIDPSVIDPSDPEILGDLVVAAVNQANKTAKDAGQDQMGGIAGGLDLGGLLG